MELPKYIKKFSVFVILFGFVLFTPKTFAATLSMEPSFGNYAVGSSVSDVVYVATDGQAANAFSGDISFPADKLQVESVSKSGSVISLWVQEPSYSNDAGTLHFEGVALNPGYNGARGRLLTVNFRAKAIGLAQVIFSSASVLANDGTGTNILKDLGNGSYNIVTAQSQNPATQTVTTPSISANAPRAPQISSETHPDPGKWYAASTAKFSWGPLDDGVTATRILFNEFPNSLPTAVYAPGISSKEVTDIKDGVWYMHVQLRNSQGWGSISHFRINVDTAPPSPVKIKFLNGNSDTDPRPVVSFATTDALSGIASYQAKIDDGNMFDIPKDAVTANNFILPVQSPGTRTLYIQATDNAGNKSASFDDFTVLPIQSPNITRYDANIKEGDMLSVEGSTYPDASVYIFVKKENGISVRHIVRSDPSGYFSFVWPTVLDSGKYSMHAQVVDGKGSQSNDSDSKEIVVSQSLVIQMGPLKISNPYLAGLFFAFQIALLFGGIYGWILFSRDRRKRYFEAVYEPKQRFVSRLKINRKK